MHRLLTKDEAAGTGECALCGPVELYFRMSRGKRIPRCPVAVEAQRDSPNRHRGSHGLTAVEARRRKIGAVCEICGHDDHLVIDHDHETMQIRAVLCSWCNSMLGFARDNPDVLVAGAEYLQKHKSRATP